jgi:hypothetical protein
MCSYISFIACDLYWYILPWDEHSSLLCFETKWWFMDHWESDGCSCEPNSFMLQYYGGENMHGKDRKQPAACNSAQCDLILTQRVHSDTSDIIWWMSSDVLTYNNVNLETHSSCFAEFVTATLSSETHRLHLLEILCLTALIICSLVQCHLLVTDLYTLPPSEKNTNYFYNYPSQQRTDGYLLLSVCNLLPQQKLSVSWDMLKPHYKTCTGSH